MHRKFLFFDYDGTLRSRALDGIPASAQGALRALKQNGHFVSLATGRLQKNAIQLSRECGMSSIVADGGHSVTVDGELLWMQPMDLEPCKRLLRWLDANNRPWALTNANELTCISPYENLPQLFSDAYIEIVINPDYDFEQETEIYKMYIPCHQGEEAAFPFNGVTWARYTEFAVCCEPTDKAFGIKKMLQIMGASDEDVIVFGDGSNDLSMFQPQWTCVAMGNAIDELKAEADLVTTHIDDDGIWNACKALDLI